MEYKDLTYKLVDKRHSQKRNPKKDNENSQRNNFRRQLKQDRYIRNCTKTHQTKNSHPKAYDKPVQETS